ncbi:BTB-domain-containing protein [Gigaspora margarita]|uniref:BTB-domain-containing protein n=1 Tax=Gigaspora margarita TaxID=4874 RepID=A0A8H4AEZ9_GIGMA|nr:BTB-domain-containing protein [Gigaspora margarita]
MKSTFLDELSNDLFELLDKAEDYNVIIQAGDPINPKEFKAHSVLLRARSGYFRSALSNDWPRKSGDLIVFRKPNIPSGIFEIILKYIYSGIIELDQLDGADLLRLMLASDELQLPILISHAQDHLIKAQPEWINQTLVPILHIVCHHDQSWNCRKTSYSNEILEGSSNFIADDYEVFQILENDGLKEKKTEVLEERRMFIHSFDGYIR